MTKTKSFIFKILAGLPLVATLVSLFFMPETVPVHFDINNQVDRWGSKYELLILPIVALVMGVVLMISAKRIDKKENSGNNNYKVFTTVGIVILAVFNIISFYILYIGFTKAQTLDNMRLDIYSLLVLMFGIMFVIIGNVMPKIRTNHLLGIRNKWTKSSEIVWKKAHRVGGFISIFTGLIAIISSFVFSGQVSMIILIGLLLVNAVVTTIYSYAVSKK